MPRIALYARDSSENQRDASIEDQLRQGRERVARAAGPRRGDLFRPGHLQGFDDPRKHSGASGR